MTLPHPAFHTDEAIGTAPGPNQWIKNHLDGLIDAHLLKDCPTSVTDTAPKPEKGLLP